MVLRNKKVKEELSMSTKCLIFNQIKIKIKGMKIFMKIKIRKLLSNQLHGLEEDIKMNSLIQNQIISHY